jgi:hypothetical protein
MSWEMISATVSTVTMCAEFGSTSQSHAEEATPVALVAPLAVVAIISLCMWFPDFIFADGS